MRGLAGALALALALAANAQTDAPDVPAGPASVSGRLIHETRPEAVADAGVLLYALSEDGGAGLRQGTTDAEGRFRFDAISNDPRIVYLVGARPGEIPFGERFRFEEGQTSHELELRLSDPIAQTADTSAAAIDLRLDRGCTHLRVAHSHQVHNPGDRVVFVPVEEREDAQPILELELPEGAEGFESPLGEGLERDGRQLRFWGPLYPGGQQVEFGYGLPLDAENLALGFPQGAPSLQVLAPKGVIAIAAVGELEPAGDVPHGGQDYATLRRGEIAPGETLTLGISLVARRAAPVRTPRAELWLELDDAALEVNERIEVAVDGHVGLPASPGEPLLCLALPPETRSLRFSPEMLAADVRRDPSGDLAIHGPLPGGVSNFGLQYRLPANSEGAALTRRFDRELPLITMLVADTGVIPETGRLHRRRSVRNADRMYLHLEGFAVEAGEAIEVALRRTPPVRGAGRWASGGFALLAGLAAFGFLSGPLRRGTPSAGEAALDPGDDDGSSLEREGIVRSLEDLDEDLETGKLSPEDHAAMRTELRARAATLLLNKPEPAPAKAVHATPEAADARCVHCNAAIRADDRFCAHCGNALRCGSCDAPLRADARFCAGCGAAQGDGAKAR